MWRLEVLEGWILKIKKKERFKSCEKGIFYASRQSRIRKSDLLLKKSTCLLKGLARLCDVAIMAAYWLISTIRKST